MKFLRLLFITLCLFSLAWISGCKSADSTEKANDNAPVAIEGAYKEAPMIAPDEFEKGMKKNRSVLVDVRMPQEFEQGHIAGAVNINFFDPGFKAALLDLDKSKKYYMYCKNDTRSERAAEYMLQNDFPEVYVLDGGYEAWIAAGKK